MSTSSIEPDEATEEGGEVGPAEDQEPQPVDDSEGGKLAAVSREAARYRRSLRTVEGERDQLAERVQGYQRREAEALAQGGASQLRSGGDLWAAGVDLSDVLDDSGGVAPERVAEAVARALADHPHWSGTQRPSPGDIGAGPRTAIPSTGWQEVIGRNR